MKRLLLVFFILPLLTTCELFDNDMPAFLDFYTGTAKIESHSADGSYIEDSNGRIHISPEEGRTITFHMNNQQKYDLNLAINWNDSLLARPAGVLEPDDYTLKQDTDNKSLINLTFTKKFLEETDKDIAVNGGDISATISLTESQSSREFESYSYLLESNSPPPPFDSKDVFLMKNDDDDYVLCFKLPHVTTTDPTHQDIETLLITDNSTETVISKYDIDFTEGNRGDGAVTNNDGKITTYTSIDLSPWLNGEPEPNSSYYANEDVIFYNTGFAVGGSINYTVKLTDDKGISSEAVISSDPPTIGGTIGVTINEVSGTVLHEGEYYTKNRTVTLRLSPVTDNVSGITGYHTTDGNKPTANAKWQNWNGNSPADSPAHTLAKPDADADGVKYIYVWIKDASGNVSVATIVKVTLTTKVPEIIVTIKEEPGTVHVADTASTYSTINSTVTLRLFAEINGKGVTGYQITNDKTASPTANSGLWDIWNGNNPLNNLTYPLKSDNSQDIYVWVKDATGNVSTTDDVAQVKVIRDTTVPAPIVAINEGSGTILGANNIYYTHSTVTLRLSAITSASGITGYLIKIDDANPPDANRGSWESWAGKNTTNSPPYVLNAPPTGVKTIRAWLKDSVGNVSAAATVQVTLLPKIVFFHADKGAGAGTLASPTNTMGRAINLLGGNDRLWSGATIFLLSTITVRGGATNWKPRTPLTLKRHTNFNKKMVSVEGGGTLTLENIILDGEKRWSDGSLINVTGSTLQIGNGVILRNNFYGIRGGGINLNNSALHMYGNAEITGNGVHSEWLGGGVYMAKNSIFNMSEDAKITNNSSGVLDSGNARGYGGGVHMAYNSGIFNMYGGIITRNLGNSESFIVGGVSGGIGNTVNMSGGLVFDNNPNR